MTGTEADPAQNGTPSGADELPAGTELLQGQYRIESFLNAGGFGITYRAVDSLERPVVIKECFPGAFCRRSRSIVQARSRAHTAEFQSIVRLFVQEARSLSKLVHPNIVGVHQVFSENDTAYMALDFVEGRDLLEILEDDSVEMPAEQIISILRHILGAVGFVHEQGMLHRDISPDNILLQEDGTPVLIDFGAARQQMQKQSRVLSALRVVKDGYSPQEFYVTGAEQGPFSDLYALGATFYHMIAGEAPPDSQSRLSARATGEADPYRPLKGNVQGYPAAVLEAIDTSLAVLPKERWQTAGDWLEAMDKKGGRVASRLVTGRVKSRVKSRLAEAETPAAATTPAAQQGRGNKMPLLAGVAVLALLAAGAGVMLTQSAETPTTVAEANTTVLAQPTETAFSTTAETPDTAPVSAAPAADADALTAEMARKVEAALLDGVPSPADALTDAMARKVRHALLANERTTAALREARLAAEAERAAYIASLPDTLRQADPSDPRDRASEDALRLAEGQAQARAYEIVKLGRVRPALRPRGAPEATPAPAAAPAATVIAKSLDIAPATPRAASSAGLAHVIAQAGHDVTLATAVPGWRDLAPIGAIEITGVPIETTPAVTSIWSVALPFNDLRADPQGTMVIRSVNGREVDTLAQFEAHLAELGLDGAADEVILQVGLGSPGAAPSLVQNLPLPVIRRIRLSNGMELHSRRNGDGWQTSVAALPEGIETDLQIGDVLVADMNGGKRLQTADAASELLDAANIRGLSTVSFAVSRNGSNQIASLTLPPQS